MKISTILDHIDSGHMALPEFQRGYVWNRDQVRGLFDSLYRRHPVGGLLVWATESKTATHRGDGPLAAGVVKLLLDGQQRMTSLYGVVRGKPPKFFDGNAQAFTGLRFHLDARDLRLLSAAEDAGRSAVDRRHRADAEGHGRAGRVRRTPQPATRPCAPKVGDYVGRLSRLLGITDIDLHVEEVTGADKTLDVVVDIFNRVNSGGTKLSKGDLALAKICADWPEARDTMKAGTQGVGGERLPLQPRLAAALGEHGADRRGEVQLPARQERGGGAGRPEAGDQAHRHLPQPDRRPPGAGPRPGALRPLRRPGHGALSRSAPAGRSTPEERDKLLFWFVQAGMWGRFSGSTESYIDQDLAALEGDGRRAGQAAGATAPVARRLAGRAGALHRLEPRRALLSGALPADAHGRGEGLGHRPAAQEQPARQDEPAGGASHLPQGAALQARTTSARR